MDSDDHEDEERAQDTTNFFTSREYKSKTDIKDAVIEYHRINHRGFKVVRSDKRRYKAECIHDSCQFVVQFAFSTSFKTPQKFIPHSCSVTQVDTGSLSVNRHAKAAHLARVPEIRALFVGDDARDVRPITIQVKLESIGIRTDYKNCINTHKRLWREFFGDDIVQYTFLASYLQSLQKRGHFTSLLLSNDSTFEKLVIVFREGLKAFSKYAFSGLQVDGTFIKTAVGGTLLIVCFRNGNKELQIVACGVVSIENEENWSWFLKFVLEKLEIPPAFVISDRDKGLLPAMTKVAPGIHHFYCYRHMMENFNKKFKSKLLRNLAWQLGRARSEQEFEASKMELKSAKAEALQWLEDIPLEKWSVCHSPCPRFGVYTSNNVESINSALRAARKLPILDMLMAIERYVGLKWSENVDKASQWEELTAKAKSCVDKCMARAFGISVKKNSSTSFLVKVTREKETPLEFVVDLNNKRNLCSCCYDKDMGGPCIHVLLCLKNVNKLKDSASFFHPLWKASTFKEAYNEEQHCHIRPFVVKQELETNDCNPPTIKKKEVDQRRREESRNKHLYH